MQESATDLVTSEDTDRRGTNPQLTSKRHETQTKTTYESTTDLETSRDTAEDDARIHYQIRNVRRDRQ